ncbi:hypothetical protein G6F50_017600 [Rhizopus delemar]|uniref:Uncharacterized protein n=1 Tax=Rhizopus delemar TaxID=936053 RepID=A0A9P6XPK7_9FUNG|nr:hypothetical protein G6F50_017600 [Rhizopus delemar]
MPRGGKTSAGRRHRHRHRRPVARTRRAVSRVAGGSVRQPVFHRHDQARQPGPPPVVLPVPAGPQPLPAALRPAPGHP